MENRMSARVITGVQKQPKVASEKRPRWLRPFSLVLAAGLLAFAAVPGNVAQSVSGNPNAVQSSLVSVLATQAQAVVSSGTRFVTDLRLLYQVPQLLEGIEAQAAPVPAARTAAPSEVIICKTAPADLAPQVKLKKSRS